MSATHAARAGTPQGTRGPIEGARDIARLAGLSAWRGLQEFYQGDDLTYAASVAY